MAVWWVTYALTDMQKQTCLKTVQEHLKWFRKGENFLNWVMAIDEIQIQDFEPELKFQNNILKSRILPRPKKFCCSWCKVKQMMIFAYDKDGIIMTDRV